MSPSDWHVETQNISPLTSLSKEHYAALSSPGLVGVTGFEPATPTSWAINEAKLRRSDNPASNIVRNLPKRKARDVVLSFNEARIVWEAAESTGYPFGTHVQLLLLTACRCDEWASARISWIDMEQALMVIPAGAYKSDHVHVVPLVSQAMEILKRIPKPKQGDYLLSSTDGRAPIQGVPKY